MKSFLKIKGALFNIDEIECIRISGSKIHVKTLDELHELILKDEDESILLFETIEDYLYEAGSLINSPEAAERRKQRVAAARHNKARII